ncbi:IclR family transcriptional regulator [Arthrobacter sp. 35W]|uniref:IclR family transcriptional regulator n=1 Tax=Arthrobacter sp. 35W TaxID=1132441 RepID=UPI00040CCDFD|nr:IclR family transcriptional regulator [Arthrobacter sp. 35W]
MAESSTRTVERALSLLAIVCDQGSATLGHCARAADLPASTALRLLRTLEGSGFVRKDDDGNYRPGSRIIQLGAQSLSNESLVSLSRESMEALVAETGESVYLSVEGHGGTAIYIAMIEGTHSVRHTNWVGRTIPLSESAAGRVLHNDVPAAGYVVVERGIEADVTAIAAPIRSETKVVAALSLVIPSYRVAEHDIDRYGHQLALAAEVVSSGLGRSTISA